MPIRLLLLFFLFIFASTIHAQINVKRYTENDIFAIKPVVNPESLKETQPESWMEKTMNEALAYMEEGAYEKALERLDAVITDNKAYPVPYYFKGIIYLEQKQLGNARSMFSKALKEEPLYMEAKYMLGVVEVEAGEYKTGFDYFETLTNAKTYESLGYYGMGIARVREGKVTGGTFYLKKAISHDPSMLDAYELMVHLNITSGNSYNAAYWLNKGIKDNPDWENGLFMRAIIALMFHNNSRIFEESMNQLIIQFPEKATYLHLYGIYYAHIKQDEKAMANFREASEKEDSEIRFTTDQSIQEEWLEHALYFLFTEYTGSPTTRAILESALCELIRSNEKSAISTLEQATGMDDLEVYNFILGIAYEQEERLEEALEMYNIAIELKENDIMLLCYRGNLLMRMDKYDQALMDYDQVVKKLPEESTLFVRRGHAYSAAGRYEDARKDFNTAIGIDSANLEAFSLRAAVFQENGDLEAAEKDATYVLARDPRHGEAYYTLHEVRLMQHDSSEAVSLLDSASYYLPGDSSKHLELATLAAQQQLQTTVHTAYERLMMVTKDFKYLMERGKVYLKMELYEAAIKDFEIYLQFDNESEDAYLQLAKAYDGMGDAKKSARYRKKASRYKSG